MIRSAPARSVPALSLTRRAAAVALLAAPLFVHAQIAGEPGAASAPEPAAAPVASASAPAPMPPAGPPTPIASDPPNWRGLSLVQRWALAPLERDWDKLDSARRSKWLEIAQRFPGLPPEERNRMHERMSAWARLSPDERQRARLGYQVAQQIRADERKAKWEAYQALSPEERKALAEKAARKQQAKPHAPSATESLAKSNLVPPEPRPLPIRPIAPSVLQARPGVSTVLINETGRRPLHQQAGQPKVFADPDLVDPHTLLPKRRPRSRDDNDKR